MDKRLTTILLEPVITEKSTALSKQNKYTFKVSRGATKTTIRNAFETAFPGRKVLSVQSLQLKGHAKRTKIGVKFPRHGKKAIITASGPKIEYFPEVS